MTEGPAGRRRRICFVIDRLAQRSGGAERVLVETANTLAARGHEVQIVSHEARPDGPFYPVAFGVIQSNLRRPDEIRSRAWDWLDRFRESLHPKVRFYRFPVGNLLWLSKWGGFWRRLESHVEAHRPDVVIAFLPPSITALGQLRASYPLRRVASLHNVPEHDLTDPGRWDPNPLDRRRRLVALDRMDAITVLLPEFRDWFPEPLRSRVTVVPNAVRPLPPGRLGRRPRRNVVLAVGRLAAVKRHDLLIEAWARLPGASAGEVAGEFADWELRIFGAGPAAAELAALVGRLGLGGSVRLMGHTGEIGEEYLAASILAHPAAFEGWGLAVTEALAAGLPVVGFEDCPGLNSLVIDGRNGLLVPAAGDRAANLAATLARLMRAPALRAELGAAAPASVSQYHPDRVADLWEAVAFGSPVAAPGEG